MSSATISQGLAAYVVATRFGEIPTGVVQKAELCVLDTIGCMLIGARDRVAETVAGHAIRHGRPGRCLVIGHSETLSPADAALANGTAAHALDWDDGHRPSGDHIGGAVVPAALAMAQETAASGPAFLLAVILGYDVMGRIGESVALPRGPGRFFHGNGVNGVFGAAVAAGKLLGLDVARMANALGIAGDGASGLREFRPTGADVKALHVGRAGRTAIDAVHLAAAGLQGSATILEGKHGFCSAISPQPRPQLILADLGQRFAVMETGFKLYPCVGTLHLPIEAALTLRGRHGIDPSAVERIRIGLPEWAVDNYGGEGAGRERLPRSVGNARFSMGFVVAAALCDGEVTPRQFTDAKVTDPRIVALEEIIDFVVDAEVDEIFAAQQQDEPYFFVPCALEIDDHGSTYRQVVRTPPGYDPNERSLSADQVVAKFRGIADATLTAPRARRLVETVLALDRSSDVSELTDQLRHGT